MAQRILSCIPTHFLSDGEYYDNTKILADVVGEAG